LLTVHTVDLVLVCVALGAVLVLAAVLARQRYMLRLPGAVPCAVQRGARWLYGIGRYQAGELRWYRAIGVGTRPSRVLRRGEVEIVGHRKRAKSERGSLPKDAVVVQCRVPGGETFAMAFGESAFTGFVSWLESSAPRF
jgi:hypothetical protein